MWAMAMHLHTQFSIGHGETKKVKERMKEIEGRGYKLVVYSDFPHFGL
jgi:hypothetical protein